MFAIDPQLVGTPATSHEHSDPDSETDNEDLEPDPTPPKRSRRGAVASGGIKKASAPSEKDMNTKEGGKAKSSKDPAPLKILEPEDWRPSPEEYKKMSSREKRQLRNKISARNFRVRRKG